MNWIKKLGIAAAATCLLCTPALAADELSVTDVTGAVENGTATYSAKVTNNTAEEANPIMVLVWYEDGVVQGINYARADAAIAASGEATLTASLSGVTVTDVTKITGFIWEDGIYTIPITMQEVERLGNGNTKIAGVTLSGIEAELIAVDNDAKTVVVNIPLFDAEGNRLTMPEGTLDATVTMENAKSSVKLDGVELAGDTTEAGKTGTLDLSTAKEISVTAEDGTVELYEFAVAKALRLDFEDGGLVTGYSHGTDGERTLTGDFTVKGKAADYMSGGLGLLDTNAICAGGLSIGTHPVSEALQSDGKTLIGNSDYTNASGKALLVKKNTYKKVNGKDANTGQSVFNIKALPDQSAATKYVLEYDVAIDYNCDPSSSRIQFGHCGVQVSGPTTTLRLGGAGAAFSNSATTKLNVGNTDGIKYGATAKDGTQWRHYKVEVTKTGAEPLYTYYIDGEQVASKTEAAMPTSISILVSAQRAAGIWIDNLSISYR